jgi:hypothetical protein
MLKICDIFGVTRYTVPRPDEMQYELNKLRNELEENKRFLREAENSIYDFIKYRAGEVIILNLIL